MTASSVVLYRMSFPITMHSQQYDPPPPPFLHKRVFHMGHKVHGICISCFKYTYRGVFPSFIMLLKWGAGEWATTVPRRSLTCPATLGDVMPTVTCHGQERPSSQLRCTNTASAGLAHRGNTDINNLAGGGGRTFNNVVKRFKLTVPRVFDEM